MSRSPWILDRNLREEAIGGEVSLGSPTKRKEELKIERKEENHSQTVPLLRLLTVFPSLLPSGNRKLWDSKSHNVMIIPFSWKGDYKVPSLQLRKRAVTKASRHPHQLLNALTEVSLTSYRKQHPNPSRFLVDNPTPPSHIHTLVIK